MLAAPGQERSPTMTQSFEQDWRKELDLLLERIETHPSHDLTAERERVAVLRQLLADLARTPVA
jgi:hypothetical protein